MAADTRDWEQCGITFAPRREHARFCSAPCRTAWNREHLSDPAAGLSALRWSITAMSDTTGRLRLAQDDAKALALGAKAVLLGRPLLYGLALAGQAGVEHVLRCFLAELDLTLALSGYANHRELNRDSVVRA